jgi:hypothetical protein
MLVSPLLLGLEEECDKAQVRQQQRGGEERERKGGGEEQEREDERALGAERLRQLLYPGTMCTPWLHKLRGQMWPYCLGLQL